MNERPTAGNDQPQPAPGGSGRRPQGWLPRLSPRWMTLGLLVLAAVIVLMVVSSTLPRGGVVPTSPALPSEPSAVSINAKAASTPLPKGVPAGLVPVTATNHPCWPINPNGSDCVQVDLENATTGQPTTPDILPPVNSGQLNASWKYYPYDSVDIHLQVLSTYNLGWCPTYNPPEWMGPCTDGSNGLPTGQGPTWMYGSPTAYLYLSVMDVLWEDFCWFCPTDDSVWHSASGQWTPPDNGHPYVGKVPTDPTSTLNNWVFDLNITAAGSGSLPNFPNGSYVMWNITQVAFNGPGGTKAMYCAPVCGGGLNGGMFYYFTKNSFYYDDVPPGTYPPYGPSGANEASDAFAANLNLTYYPVVPNIQDQVDVDLRIQNVNNLSGGLIDITHTIVVLQAWYPNGTFWRSWVSTFTPLAAPYNETWHARVILPEDFFQHSGTRVQWFVEAYDQAHHVVQSRNYTQVVAPIGICPQANFTECLNLTTVPAVISQEGYGGYLLSSGVPTVPGVAPNNVVNVTITTVQRSIDIEEAFIVLHVQYPQTGGNETRQYSMNRTTLNQYYFDVPTLPEGTNVTFVVKALDFNETLVISHPYRFFVHLSIAPPISDCFFYVQVYNAQTAQAVNGANVTITGQGGTLTVKTRTAIDGVAYPNVSGEHWTPLFLLANYTYEVSVQIPGFASPGLLGNTISASFVCLHDMDTSQVLATGSNYQVVLKNDVLNFTLNQPTAPPIFAEVVDPGISVGTLGGMAVGAVVVIPVFLIWRRQRAIAEAEEKRITL